MFKLASAMIDGAPGSVDWEGLARVAEFKPSRMASLCSISERQLQRIFKQQLSCTPRQWLRGLRCRLAKDLITKGFSSKAVAAELKFSNGSHFCKEFKKVFGTSPQYFAPNHLNTLRLAVLATQFEPGNAPPNGFDIVPRTDA